MVDQARRGQSRQTDKQRTRRSSQMTDDDLSDDLTLDEDDRIALNRDGGYIAELEKRLKAIEARL